MESLVHYKQLLVRKHSELFGPEERQAIKMSCFDLLQQLQTVDSERRNRYAELGACDCPFMDHVIDFSNSESHTRSEDIA